MVWQRPSFWRNRLYRRATAFRLRDSVPVGPIGIRPGDRSKALDIPEIRKAGAKLPFQELKGVKRLLIGH